MTKKLIFLFIILMVLGACKSKKPKGVLSQEELAKFLTEIYLAEAKLDNSQSPRDSSQKLFIPFEQALLKKQNLNDTIIKETYRYYMQHSTELEKVYDIVIDTLVLHEQKALKPPTTPK